MIFFFFKFRRVEFKEKQTFKDAGITTKLLKTF